MARIPGVFALSVLLLMTACGTQSVSVPNSAGTARLSEGTVLEVDFGYVNPSIGDSWHLVGKLDRKVLTDLGDEFEAEEDGDGAGGQLTWRFEAGQPGTSTLRFQYCYRSSPPDCQGNDEPAPDPVRLDVMVEAG